MKRVKSYFSQHPLIANDRSIPISISFGVASTEGKSVKDPGSLLKDADEMLYLAKKSSVKDSDRQFSDKLQPTAEIGFLKKNESQKKGPVS